MGTLTERLNYAQKQQYLRDTWELFLKHIQPTRENRELIQSSRLFQDVELNEVVAALSKEYLVEAISKPGGTRLLLKRTPSSRPRRLGTVTLGIVLGHP
jgi:hypothetical protein